MMPTKKPVMAVALRMGGPTKDEDMKHLEDPAEEKEGKDDSGIEELVQKMLSASSPQKKDAAIEELISKLEALKSAEETSESPEEESSEDESAEGEDKGMSY